MPNHDRSAWRLIEPPGKRQSGASLAESSSAETQWLSFLLAASNLFHSSLSLETTLQNVVRGAVPFLADCCFLHLREGAGLMRRVFWSHGREYETLPYGNGFAEPRCYRAGGAPSNEPELVPLTPPGWTDALAANSSEAAWFRKLPCRSAIRVPVANNGSSIGVMTFLSASRTYGIAETGLAAEIARMAYAAIENAREHTRSLEDSATPQHVRMGRDQVVAALNHELRNLLAPVLGWARILRDHSTVRRDAILWEGAQSLERNAAHMARLVDDCVDISRMAEGKLCLHRTVVDLNEIMLAAVEAVREAAWEKKHSLLVELSSSPLWVEGDSTRLQQVGMNLLGNAVKYTGAGGQLYVRSFQLEREVEIEVTDTGRGVESAELPHIFEPFRQGTSPSHSGLGLGLAISRQIVALHRGRLWAESPGRGCGCSFRFRLPRSAPPPKAAAAIAARAIDALQPRRILLVEDVSDVRTLMKVQMEALGHDVVALSDAWSALAQARHKPPDLIVSDIKMSGLDGYSLARLIRSDPVTARIPILGVTGVSSPHDMHEAQNAGFNACLCKPVEDDELGYWIDRLTREPNATASEPG